MAFSQKHLKSRKYRLSSWEIASCSLNCPSETSALPDSMKKFAILLLADIFAEQPADPNTVDSVEVELETEFFHQ